MKHIARLSKHNMSYKVVLPKKLVQALGWQFSDLVVIAPGPDRTIKIKSLEDWAKERKDDKMHILRKR